MTMSGQALRVCLVVCWVWVCVNVYVRTRMYVCVYFLVAYNSSEESSDFYHLGQQCFCLLLLDRLPRRSIGGWKGVVLFFVGEASLWRSGTY